MERRKPADKDKCMQLIENGTCLPVCTAKINLSDELDLEDYVSRSYKISVAEIAAICQEAGMQ
ncbi:UNVERIFIED_CONTAM: 26S proteasome regulatory subunitB [Sesamum radiatum]|uniref:26S proteasome regulatory subunitB n=1 Tax=Sesamum radiatum TaxID=300843 RepID=A0AAW2T5G9_SESRA